MPDLIAARDMRYATRALAAGDPFQANNRDARLLVALKRAKLATPDAAGSPPASTPASAPPSAGGVQHTEPEIPNVQTVIDGLREEAGKLGIDVHHRWGEKRLKEEIAKAQAARD